MVMIRNERVRYVFIINYFSPKMQDKYYHDSVIEGMVGGI
jgi:hypothetical protein